MPDRWLWSPDFPRWENRRLRGTITRIVRIGDFQMISLRTAASAAATAAILAGGGLFAGVTGANAATVACKTTHTYTHTTSATGAHSQTWTTKDACGKNYRKWEHRISVTAKGASSDEELYKIETYPHFWQREVLNSVSAKGAVSYKVTVTTG
jgi:hypothetical protein